MEGVDAGQIPPQKDAVVKQEVRKPIGDVIIGKVDPSTLTREQFDSSPDLLYHGTGENQFSFRRDIDYNTFVRPVSATVGEGFYVTDNKTDAEFFSHARLSGGGVSKENDPLVVTLLPYQARMLDLRSQINQQQNGHVPQSFLDSWTTYYQQHMESFFPKNYDPQEDINFVNTTSGTNDSAILEERRMRAGRCKYYTTATNYMSRLQRWSKNQRPTDLREMLSIDGNPAASEFGAREFPGFMRSVEYDGLIYIEGGDVQEQRDRNPISYVFYNLDKIGTYDTWHTEEKKIA